MKPILLLNRHARRAWLTYLGSLNGLINGPGVTDGMGAGYPAPQDGNQFVDIGKGELSQTFTVITTGDYSLGDAE